MKWKWISFVRIMRFFERYSAKFSTIFSKRQFPQTSALFISQHVQPPMRAVHVWDNGNGGRSCWTWRRFSSFKWQVVFLPHPSSHSSTFPITPFPRGITQSWLLLLITHGSQKCSSCLEKWDHCRAGGSAAADELGEKWKLIKSFKLAWKTKEREIWSFGEGISGTFPTDLC